MSDAENTQPAKAGDVDKQDEQALRARICRALDIKGNLSDDEIVTAAELHHYEFQRLFAADVVRAMRAPAEGAIARCSYCGRYSLDRKTLSDRQPPCECGEKHGWSGSFVKPGPDAKWSGLAPESAVVLDGERAAFEWPPLPVLPETGFTSCRAGGLFTEHQMQGCANAYGEAVRAAAGGQIEIIRALQKALFYWMPRIAGEDSPAGKKAAEHAYLLIGLDDNSTECWGDQILHYVGTMNREQERLGIVLGDVGCSEDDDYLEFIQNLAARAASPQATATQAIPDNVREVMWSIVRRLDKGYKPQVCATELRALLAPQPTTGAQ